MAENYPLWGRPPRPSRKGIAERPPPRISPCHAERSGEDREAILSAQSKHPYPTRTRKRCHPERDAFCLAKDPGEPRDASRSLRRNNSAFGSHPYPHIAKRYNPPHRLHRKPVSRHLKSLEDNRQSWLTNYPHSPTHTTRSNP